MRKIGINSQQAREPGSYSRNPIKYIVPYAGRVSKLKQPYYSTQI
jgi:hypothetical protein